MMYVMESFTGESYEHMGVYLDRHSICIDLENNTGRGKKNNTVCKREGEKQCGYLLLFHSWTGIWRELKTKTAISATKAKIIYLA